MIQNSWVRLLRDAASEDPSARSTKELVDLLLIIDNPNAFPPSDEYERYTNQVTSKISKLTKEEARQFVADIYSLSQSISVPPVVAFFRPLKEYVNRFSKTPELLVVLFAYSDLVGETANADDYLRQASFLDPDNEYVLWQRVVARGSPWFPEELTHGSNLLEEELWLTSRILQRNPSDPLALGVERRLNETRKSLFVHENLEFLNSLVRIIPDPMKHIGLQSLLWPPKTSEMPR